MKPRSIRILLSVLLCSVGEWVAGMGLEEYRSRVTTYSHALKMSRLSVSTAANGLRSARAGLLPQLDIAGNMAYALSRKYVVNGSLRQYVKPWSLDIQPTLVQTLYAGGERRHRYRQAQIEEDIAMCEESFTRLDIVYAADYAYWSLAAADRLYRAWVDYCDIILSLKEVIDLRFADGYISRSDVLMIDARLSQASYELLGAQTARLAALHNFNILMGAPVDSLPVLSDSLSVGLYADQSPATTSVAAYPRPERVNFDRVMAARADVAAAALRIDLAAEGIGLVRSTYNPQLSVAVGGVWQSVRPNLSWSTAIDAAAYVKLSVPILHWGARRADVAVARNAYSSARYSFDQLSDAVRLDESNTWSDIVQGEQLCHSAVRSLTIARENLSLSTFAYNEGRLTILDVLSAQLSWIQLYTNAIDAELNYLLAIARYNNLTAREVSVLGE